MISKQLSYEQLCDYFSDKCKICGGKKRVTKNGIHTVCSCQLRATVKHRIDGIEISPYFLKYKKWYDFTGIIGNDEITGQLNLQSAKNALSSALLYCFDTDNLDLIQDRKNHLNIHRHMYDGQNVIISGDKDSGKTMLAALILKEIAYTYLVHGTNLDFTLIKFSEFMNAARWSNSKDVDEERLNRLADMDFLVIDGINKIESGHNTPADMYSLNSLFNRRNVYNRPTIFTCSKNFLVMCKSKINSKMIIDFLGDEFYSMFIRQSNCFIDLQKEKVGNGS